jgi:hypothetical protein
VYAATSLGAGLKGIEMGERPGIMLVVPETVAPWVLSDLDLATNPVALFDDLCQQYQTAKVGP